MIPIATSKQQSRQKFDGEPGKETAREEPSLDQSLPWRQETCPEPQAAPVQEHSEKDRGQTQKLSQVIVTQPHGHSRVHTAPPTQPH